MVTVILIKEKIIPEIAKILSFVPKFSFLPLAKAANPRINADGLNTKLKPNREINPKTNAKMARYFANCFVLVSLKLSPLSKSGFKSQGGTRLVSKDLLFSKVKRRPNIIAGTRLKIVAQTIKRIPS